LRGPYHGLLAPGWAGAYSFGPMSTPDVHYV
jgi:hypothetical protein